MAYGFAGTVEQLIATSRRPDFGSYLSRGRINAGGYALSSLEHQVWAADASMLGQMLEAAPIPAERTFVLCEYDIPGHLGRCDVILLGRARDGSPHAAVLELKRWPRIDEVVDTDYVRVGGRLHLHPALQATQYVERLKLFHPEGRRFAWHPVAVMSVMESSQYSAFQRSSHQDLVSWGLSVSFEPAHRALEAWFGGGADASEGEQFSNAGFRQDRRFAEELVRMLPNVTRGVAEGLGRPPLDLSSEQEEIVAAIAQAITAGRAALVLVAGAPGAGKTIVGLHALVEQLARDPDRRVVLALRNNRLCEAVRQAINRAVRQGLGAALVKYVKGGGPGIGLFYEVRDQRRHRGDEFLYELVVVDEAHRIPGTNPRGPNGSLTQLEAVLRAGRVVVCLIDEGQVLNEDDAGNRSNVLATWHNVRRNDSQVIDLRLTDQHRLPPGQAQWLESFLEGDVQTRSTDYEMRICQTAAEVVESLRARTADGECGLLASYTRVNGRGQNKERMTDPRVEWLMEKEDCATVRRRWASLDKGQNSPTSFCSWASAGWRGKRS
jgi:hypothetical protein